MLRIATFTLAASLAASAVKIWKLECFRMKLRALWHGLTSINQPMG